VFRVCENSCDMANMTAATVPQRQTRACSAEVAATEEAAATAARGMMIHLAHPVSEACSRLLPLDPLAPLASLTQTQQQKAS